MSEEPRTGAPEVTAEMIEAGVSALCGFDRRFEDERDAVVDIYTAMERAKAARRG
jgi:hypothetical protein